MSEKQTKQSYHHFTAKTHFASEHGSDEEAVKHARDQQEDPVLKTQRSRDGVVVYERPTQ